MTLRLKVCSIHLMIYMIVAQCNTQEFITYTIISSVFWLEETGIPGVNLRQLVKY